MIISQDIDLECILCVLDEVNSEVEVNGRGYVWCESCQSEDLDCPAGRSAWLSGQSVPSQAVSHHVTLAGVHLNVDGSVDSLVTQLTDRLHTSPHHTR